jgi:HTH-type transcriptional regulator, sugar sensing transcriptional regulator
LKSEERIEILVDLGLTFNQARTYLALVQAGPSTAKEIAEISRIARPDMYRIIPTLQKEGMVEKLITRPVRFKAIPMLEILPIMLNRKREDQNELKLKTQELLSDFKNIHAKEREESNEFSIVPGKKFIMLKLTENLLKAQANVYVVTSQKRFSTAILEFEKVYLKALKRGVTIKIGTDKHLPEEKVVKILQRLTSNPNFQVRCFDEAPLAIVSVFDNKEAFVTLSATSHLEGTSSIWSNNPCFIALAQSYFEKEWNNASDFL